MLADLHAITVSVNPDELRENILNSLNEHIEFVVINTA